MRTSQFQFVELSDGDRRKVTALRRPGPGETVEVRVVPSKAAPDALPLPQKAADLVTEVLSRLARGERVAVLGEDQELTPNEASRVLGLSRPLVVRRMDIGELAFRYVGKHRRLKLSDVLSLKAKLDEQQIAIDELAERTERLMTTYDA